MIAIAAVGTVVALRRVRPFPVAVEGPSMAPTLRADEYVVAVRPRRLRRGDIVVVRPPEHGFEMVKRVVGLPGEKVEVSDGLVRVDGRPLAEPYGHGSGAAGAWSLGDGEYVVLGDDRSLSTDSRSFGPLRREAIIGVVVLRYWPRISLIYAPPGTGRSGRTRSSCHSSP